MDTEIDETILDAIDEIVLLDTMDDDDLIGVSTKGPDFA